MAFHLVARILGIIQINFTKFIKQKDSCISSITNCNHSGYLFTYLFMIYSPSLECKFLEESRFLTIFFTVVT